MKIHAQRIDEVPSGAVTGSFGAGSSLSHMVHKFSVDKKGKIKVEQSKISSSKPVSSFEESEYRDSLTKSKLKQKELDYFQKVYNVDDKLGVILKTRNILKNIYRRSVIKDRPS